MSRILNQVVVNSLKSHVLRDYQLDQPGTEMVFAANSNLNESYTTEHDWSCPSEYLELIVATLSKYALRTYAVAVDVCCGTGFLSEYLIDKKVIEKSYAVDLNESSIFRLKQKLEKFPDRKITPLFMNFFDLQIAEHQVDLVIGNSFLHHLPDNRAFFKKSYELLKPGGVLFLTHEPSIWAELWENPLAYFRNLLGLSRKKYRLSDIWLYSEEGLHSMMTEAGFKNIQIQGHGLFTSVITFVFYFLWTRILQRGPLSAQFYEIIYYLRIKERKLLWFLPNNFFVSLMIVAEK